MSFDSYSELKAEIAAWINRPEIEPAVAGFIQLAEATIRARLAEHGIPASWQRVSGETAGEYLQPPGDLGIPVSVSIGGQSLGALTAGGLQALRDSDGPLPHRPRYYAVAGDSLRFHPPPDGAYPVELVYQALLPALTATNATNWVLAAYPDVYLWGSLLKAAPFLGEDRRLAGLSSLFEDACAGLIKTERAKRGSRATPAYRTDLPIGRPAGAGSLA